MIEDGCHRLAARHGEAKLFIGPPAAPAIARFFTFPELIAVTDLASVLQAATQRRVASGAFVGSITYSSGVARSAGTDTMTGGTRRCGTEESWQR